MADEGNEAHIGCMLKGNSVVVSCGRLLDVSAARELHYSLRQSLDSELPIEIDVSVVERIDAAILQLLYAFVRDAISSGKKLSWNQPTQAFLAAAQLLQLQNSLCLPSKELAL
jgi:ABC-type transporter Mla MlaB component